MSYYGHYGVLLASAVVLVTHPDDVFADNGFAMTLPDSKVSQGAASDPPALNDDNQVTRHFRNHNKTMADDDNFEDRLLGAGTGLESVLDTAVQKTKVLVGAAEPKTTFAQQQKVDEHFNRLMPEGVESLNFGTKGFQDWDRYVNELYAKSPGDADVAVITTLMSYVDDARLTQMLLAAEKVEETKAIAARLMEAQFKYWLAMKKNAEDVFGLLKLDEKTGMHLTDMFLSDPMVRTWISYVGKSHEKSPIGSVWAVLKGYVKEDDALVRMFLEAEKLEETKAIATGLMKAQLKYWRVLEKNADDVFKVLKLDEKKANMLLTDPMMPTWLSYVDKLDDQTQVEEVWPAFLAYFKNEATLSQMLIEAMKVEETKAMATRLIEIQLKYCLANGRSADHVFTLLRLQKKIKTLSTDMFLVDPVVRAWISYVGESNERLQSKLVWLILRKHVKKDDALVRMFLEAEKLEETKAIATGLMKAQLKYWRALEKSADTVFKLLKLDKKAIKLTTEKLSTDMLLTDPMVKVWISYVGKVDEKHQAELVLESIRRYVKEDDALVRMFLEAEKVEETKALASKLIEEQIEDWLSTMTQISDVFELLKLDKKAIKLTTEKLSTDMLLTDPMVKVWISYVEKVDEKHQAELVLESIRRYVKEDDALVRMFLEVEKVEETKALASKLIEEQIKDWVSQKRDAKTLFWDLKLHERTDMLLTDPMLKVWLSYVYESDKYFPTQRMWAILKDSLDDSTRVKMLVESEKIEETKDLATNLLNRQFASWANRKEHADNVFMLLNLDDKTDMFLMDPLVKRWISYVGVVNKHEEAKTIWDTLKIHFEEDVIAKIIFEGKKDHLTRDVAQKLEDMQLSNWVMSKTSADEVYKLVKVGSEKGNPFEQPGFNIWASYVMQINKKSPYEILMVELKARYNDDRALAELLAVEKARNGLDSIEHLQKLQYQDWLDQQKTADDIFTLLKLHERGNKIFEDKLWHTWVSYLAKLAEQTGERQEALMYSVLKKYNNEKDMMKLIQTARKNRDTEPIAATLLSEKWQDEQKSGIGTFKDWLRSYLP